MVILRLTEAEVVNLWHLLRNNERAVHDYGVQTVQRKVADEKLRLDNEEYQRTHGVPRPPPWNKFPG